MPKLGKRSRMLRIMVTPREEREWRKAAEVESEGNVSALVRDLVNKSPALAKIREEKTT